MTACICGHPTGDHDQVSRRCLKCPCFHYRLVAADEYVARQLRDFDALCDQIAWLHYAPMITTRIQ